MSNIKELKEATKQTSKGSSITETDYVLRDKSKESDKANTVIMEDSSKYKEQIEAAKAQLSGDARALMKAELLAEIRAELQAEAKQPKTKAEPKGAE